MLSSLSLLLAAQGAQPPDDFPKLWDSAAKAIRSSYYARSTRAAELDKYLGEHAAQARQARSREEFASALDLAIADFGDSHFDFLPDSRQGFYLMDSLARRDAVPMPNIGAWFRPEKGRYVVGMVLDGLAAQQAGLRKGDVVTRVNGQPFSPIESLRPLVGKEATFTIGRGDKVFEKNMTVTQQPALEMFLEATRNSIRIIEQGGKRIGYIHLWTQANDEFRTTLQGAVYGKLRDTDAFILDLRDGFGGRPEGYMDPFYRPESTLEWKYGGENARTMKQLFGYGRPLVVLINEGSRSAKEVLSLIVKNSGRATLIGRRTAGDVLGTSPFRVSPWAYLEIPIVDLYVDGFRIERQGVKPDIELANELSPDGADLHLARALEYLGHGRATMPGKRPSETLSLGRRLKAG